MRTGGVTTISFLLFVCVLTGCAGVIVSSRDLENFDKYQMKYATSKEYSYPKDEIVKAVHNALAAAELNLDRETTLDDGTHVIYAEAGPFLLRQGEVARISVHTLGDQKSLVRVYTTKKMPRNATEKYQSEYADQIFKSIEKEYRGSEISDRYRALEGN